MLQMRICGDFETCHVGSPKPTKVPTPLGVNAMQSPDDPIVSPTPPNGGTGFPQLLESPGKELALEKSWNLEKTLVAPRILLSQGKCPGNENHDVLILRLYI